MAWRNRLVDEVIVPISRGRRTGDRVRTALDQAIVDVAAQHPTVWPRGLITTIAEAHGVRPAKVHARRRLLLPGTRSARGNRYQ